MDSYLQDVKTTYFFMRLNKNNTFQVNIVRKEYQGSHSLEVKKYMYYNIQI